MRYDKKTFIENVTILCDTRERCNRHILEHFKTQKIAFIPVKLDFGDYSFAFHNRDFSLSCVIERKSSVQELYSNFVVDRERIEKEFFAVSRILNHFILLIEQCESLEALKQYSLSDFEMKNIQRKVRKIGELCYYTVRSWQCGNRYKFHTLFIEDPANTATAILEEFYYYWRN